MQLSTRNSAMNLLAPENYMVQEKLALSRSPVTNRQKTIVDGRCNCLPINL